MCRCLCLYFGIFWLTLGVCLSRGLLLLKTGAQISHLGLQRHGLHNKLEHTSNGVHEHQSEQAKVAVALGAELALAVDADLHEADGPAHLRRRGGAARRGGGGEGADAVIEPRERVVRVEDGQQEPQGDEAEQKDQLGSRAQATGRPGETPPHPRRKRELGEDGAIWDTSGRSRGGAEAESKGKGRVSSHVSYVFFAFCFSALILGDFW